MKVTIHAEGTGNEIAAQLEEAAIAFRSAGEVGGKPVKRSEKLAAKNAEKEESEETEETETNEDDGGFGEAEEGAPEAEEAPELSLDDVIEACQKHAKAAGGREKTQALLLKQFKCKNVKQLKPADFAKVIAALKKK